TCNLVFSHLSGEFKPLIPVYNDDDVADSQSLSGIKVSYRSGDVVDAPDDFVIALRPTKSKVVQKPHNPNDEGIVHDFGACSNSNLSAHSIHKECEQEIANERKNMIEAEDQNVKDKEFSKEHSHTSPYKLNVEELQINREMDYDNTFKANGYVPVIEHTTVENIKDNEATDKAFVDVPVIITSSVETENVESSCDATSNNTCKELPSHEVREQLDPPVTSQ
ncbi:hypothetical protein SK128_004522, partial [Halocaridina rubra]